ncbi:hypothetical protein KC19_VG027300, partial [Ceratodon purpureus]
MLCCFSIVERSTRTGYASAFQLQPTSSQLLQLLNHVHRANLCTRRRDQAHYNTKAQDVNSKPQISGCETEAIPYAKDVTWRRINKPSPNHPESTSIYSDGCYFADKQHQENASPGFPDSAPLRFTNNQHRENTSPVIPDSASLPARLGRVFNSTHRATKISSPGVLKESPSRCPRLPQPQPPLTPGCCSGCEALVSQCEQLLVALKEAKRKQPEKERLAEEREQQIRHLTQLLQSGDLPQSKGKFHQASRNFQICLYSIWSRKESRSQKKVMEHTCISNAKSMTDTTYMSTTPQHIDRRHIIDTSLKTITDRERTHQARLRLTRETTNTLQHSPCNKLQQARRNNLQQARRPLTQLWKFHFISNGTRKVSLPQLLLLITIDRRLTEVIPNCSKNTSQ